MTYKQAVKIRSIFCNRIPYEELHTPLTEELAIEIDNAIKKQIPEKPIEQCGRYFGKAKGGRCPICNAQVNSKEYLYCRQCGQALDWSDTE